MKARDRVGRELLFLMVRERVDESGVGWGGYDRFV